MLAVPSTDRRSDHASRSCDLRDVPGRKRRRFIGIASDMETERGLSRLLGKFQVRRRVIAGIAPDHDELVDDAGIKGVREIATNCRRRGLRRCDRRVRSDRPAPANGR